MSRCSRFAVFALAALTLSGHSFAQNYINLLPSADLAVAPQYPSAVPNNGQPIASMHNITGFDRTFGYGSSSTNTRRADGNINQNTNPGATSTFTEVNSNGHAIYIELFSPLVGAVNGRGSHFPGATNLADGGSTSVTALTGSPAGCTLNTAPAGSPPNGTCTQQPQVQEFQAIYGRYRPGDIVVQWSGINDINRNGINTQAVVDQIVAQDVTNQTLMVQQNIALGAKNYVFVGLADLGTFANFTTLRPTNDPALVTQAAERTNAGNLANLIALKQANPGVNIHYFDSERFVNEIRANPTAYGFTPAGVAPNAYGVGSAGGSVQAYNSQPFGQQNEFLTMDGLHWTYRFHEWEALAIANQLLAPYSVAAQADLTQIGGMAFSNSMFRMIDDYRLRGAFAELSMKDWIPERPSYHYGALSVFAQGEYSQGDRADRFGATGFSYSMSGITAGAEFSPLPHMIMGVAFNYSNPEATLNNGFGTIKSDLFQGGGYASISYPNWFADAAFSIGSSDLHVIRPGLVSNLTGDTTGSAVTFGTKAGYLFDLASFLPAEGHLKAGPIAGITFAHVDIDGYTEKGDPMLTQIIGGQSVDSATGRVGVELRYPMVFGSTAINPWIDVTLERDLLGGARTIVSAQTYSPLLTISTPVSGVAQTYGRVAGGLSAAVSNNVSVNINGETTFATKYGDDHRMMGGVKITW
jgi:outer membrane lipase/esterase